MQITCVTRTEVCSRPSQMPATVNTPPTTAQVVVRKWYHARPFSATMICTGDNAYETYAVPEMSASVRAAWPEDVHDCTCCTSRGFPEARFPWQ